MVCLLIAAGGQFKFQYQINTSLCLFSSWARSVKFSHFKGPWFLNWLISLFSSCCLSVLLSCCFGVLLEMSVQHSLVLCGLIIFQMVWGSTSEVYTSSAAALNGSNDTNTSVILLGGLFPVHKNEDNKCGSILDLGIQRLEAMVFASQLINELPHLLPEVEIGFEIRDTCVHSNIALEESLKLAIDRGGDDGLSTGVSGVVGAASSGVSIVVASLLRLFSTPQISYASTAKILSDKTRFDYFFRTVPPDSLQARAMAAIVEEFGWTFVHAFYSDDAYGSEGIEAFFQEITEIVGQNRSKICIASTAKIPHGVSSESVFDDAIEELDGEWVGNSSVVVLFGQLSTATGVLTAMKKRDRLEPGFAERFTWIGSDAWGDQLPPEFHSVANGMISVSPKASVSSDFDEYFTALNPRDYVDNPWFIEYWEAFFNCSFDNESVSHGQCNPDEQAISHESGYVQNSKVTFTIDAVFAFAHAIHNIITTKCSNNQLCPEITEERPGSGGVAIKGTLLLDSLKNISFPGMSGGTIQFDSSGDEQGEFVIKNLKWSVDTNRYFYETIGTWSPFTGLNLYGDIKWNGGIDEVPTSICSLPCEGGEFPEQIPEQSACCWYCTPCLGEKFVSIGEECSECSAGFKPNNQKTECTAIVPTFLMWQDPWSVIIILVAIFGMAATLAVGITMIVNRDHPLVKASSRELSAVMLTGLALCYFLPFLFIAKPSIPLCTLRRFGVGFAFSICYSAVLVKANRIYRIFDRAKSSLQQPPLISPRSQLIFTFFLISVQAAVNIVWLTVEYPFVQVIYADFDGELICAGSPIAGFFVYLGFNLFLLLASCYYGCKSRKIPQTFNETKLINFMLLSTIMLWAGLTPAYFTTGVYGGSTYQTIALILGIILGATIMFVILFISKMYYLISEKRKEIKEYNETIKAQTILGSNAITDRSTMNAARRKKRFSMDLLGECCMHTALMVVVHHWGGGGGLTLAALYTLLFFLTGYWDIASVFTKWHLAFMEIMRH